MPGAGASHPICLRVLYSVYRIYTLGCSCAGGAPLCIKRGREDKVPPLTFRLLLEPCRDRSYTH